MIDVERAFVYHPPQGNQTERYEQLRAKAKELAQLIVALTPSSGEQTIALRSLQETIMFANAAIAINEVEPEPPYA